MNELAQQTVVIVGASSGIGLATARAAGQEGARVVLMGRSREKLEGATRAVGGASQAVAVDMLDPEAVGGAFATVGPLDHLVLTAVGDEYATFGSIADVTGAQLERSLDKVRGYVNVTRAAAPRIRERGSITLLSGAGAAKPRAGTSLAAAANGALVSFGRVLALELAPRRVNVVMPGVVDTPLHGHRREQLQRWAESPDLPARHFGQPEDIARAILFLMTDRYVTGHTLVVDGGLLLT